MLRACARATALVGFAFGLAASVLVAQQPFTPGVAFGAAVFPHVDGVRDTWAVQFDLFTELSKDLDSTGAFQRYNDIDRTIGVNQLGWSRTWQRQLAPSWFFHPTLWVAGGIVWDAPTEVLQNDVAHGLRLLTYVPRDGTIDHAVLGAGGDANVSYGRALGSLLDLTLVGGVGTGLSTSYMDGYGQVGAELALGPPLNPWLAVGGLGRIGLTSDPFYWEGFEDGLHGAYKMWQAWVLVAPGSLFGTPWVPQVRVGFTRSHGPWLESLTRDPITENLWSIRLESLPGQWAVEMWNDFVFKDLGPTFGLRVQWYS